MSARDGHDSQGTIRVLACDDSTVVHRLLARVFRDVPDIELVGTATNGRLALSRIDVLAPDAILLDVEMPVMDGLETVRALRARGATQPIIMFSTLTVRGGEATFEALSRGADDYVPKPEGHGSLAAAIDATREILVPKLRALVGRRRLAARARARPRPAGE
ncbi:MAG TPA: response regulator, partial [Sandaracinaceae bacterium LLY-WYZ-13_1]|nr:response regulator [Sandaracinaceae bacterium LLY-WYZ-13_1]